MLIFLLLLLLAEHTRGFYNVLCKIWRILIRRWNSLHLLLNVHSVRKTCSLKTFYCSVWKNKESFQRTVDFDINQSVQLYLKWEYWAEYKLDCKWNCWSYKHFMSFSLYRKHTVFVINYTGKLWISICSCKSNSITCGWQ